ncbi:hypothetical protein DENIT_20104 [Pseudomonas veronii]|uniref:hypothetical protein n=1 Tax=Pseudomonas veronii TaxID=76761 RepID=UPI0017683916|nr:hypothetical protein [Pseudomonas veronii]CAD0264217.1 hypothetical protein DENIT_20104 [Pseudomonas veronii]
MEILLLFFATIGGSYQYEPKILLLTTLFILIILATTSVLAYVVRRCTNDLGSSE